MKRGRSSAWRKKENGKLAKAIAAPYKAERAAFVGLKKSIDKAVAALDSMDEKQAALKAERANRPDMLAKIAKKQERVERDKRERPAHERAIDSAVTV